MFDFIKIKYKGWIGSVTNRVLALHAAKKGLIPGTPHGPSPEPNVE